MTGKQTIAYAHPPGIAARASIVGKREGEGPLGGCFDEILPDDLLGQKSFEAAEREMLLRTVQLCIRKGGMTEKGIDAVLMGDLNNQITASGFCARTLGIPFFGLYGACSTMTESLLLGAALISGGMLDTAVCAACSHFCTAERQFRYPLELGTQRPPSAQTTATAAGAMLLTGEKGASVTITHGTIGVMIDWAISDANHMGAAMAPAVADTIAAHFRDTGRSAADYDRVVTGDLGHIGRELLLVLLAEKGIRVAEEFIYDCGDHLFSPQQDAHAGGSGCGCIASVSCGHILAQMEQGEWRRILLTGSGAMLSPMSTQQGESIPGIAYAVALESGGKQ